MAEEKKREERALVKPWQAINPLDVMRDTVGRVFETFLEPLARIAPPDLRIPVRRFTPSVDVIEEDDAIRVDVEAPGMNPEDLSVSVSGDYLIIRGEKKEETRECVVGVHCSERSYGAFRRSVPLPVDVDRDKVDASFKNGILSITLPKSGDAGRKVKIRVEGA
jgi:HSP20 family protein